MTRIIVVRHGQSEANAKDIHQGQRVDTGLSVLGKKQAEKLAKSLKDEKIEVIYSSDLKRAMETAKAIAKPHRLKVIADRRLREFDSGDFTELKDRWEVYNKYREEEAKKRGIEKHHIRIPGGESEEDHYLRSKDFFEMILKHKGTVVVVAHGGSNKILFNLMGHVPRDKMYEIPQDYTAVNVLELRKGKFVALKINDISHLSTE